MQYTRLGRSGLRVSRIGLGTWNFGWQTEPDAAHTVLDAALDAGINLVDTANVYGQPWAEGVTERIIGDWFSKGSGRRERTVLATKLYGSMLDWPNHEKLSKLSIRRACEDSLRRLRTDHIDIYQMHHIDRETPWEEIWEAMELLVAQGKVLYIGSSNFAGWHIAKAQEAARARGFFGLVSEQSKYSLLERTVELEVLPACEDYGVGVLPYSPLGGGLLAGVLGKQTVGRSATGAVRDSVTRHLLQLEAYEELCDELAEDPANVGLAWLLAQPAVTAPIIGPRTVEQLSTSLTAVETQLEPDLLDRLDAIFPAVGPAPEAYAW